MTRRIIPVNVVDSMVNKIRKGLNVAVKVNLENSGALLLKSLRTGVVNGELLNGKRVRNEKVNSYVISFDGNDKSWGELYDWNYGVKPTTHKIIPLSDEQAERMATKMKKDYTDRGKDWRNSEAIRKVIEEKRIIRKLKKPVGGRVGTHVIEKRIDTIVNKNLLPSINKSISKILRSLAN